MLVTAHRGRRTGPTRTPKQKGVLTGASLERTMGLARHKSGGGPSIYIREPPPVPRDGAAGSGGNVCP